MNNIQVLVEDKKKHNYIPLLLLFGLLFLRFPFLILVLFDKIPISKVIGSNVFQDGTYLLTAMLIFVKRDSLSEYNMDFAALFIFMIAPVAKIISEYFLNANMIQSDWWLQIAISVCLLSYTIPISSQITQKRNQRDTIMVPDCSCSRNMLRFINGLHNKSPK
jgi:hypothetical protein